MNGDAVNIFLEHHGIKGQKWGIRNSIKSYFNRPKNTHSPESDYVLALRKKPAYSLTDAQLKVVNNRLNLEQNYNRMNPRKIAKGEVHAKQVIAGVATLTTLATFANTAWGKSLINIGAKAVTNLPKHLPLPLP